VGARLNCFSVFPSGLEHRASGAYPRPNGRMNLLYLFDNQTIIIQKVSVLNEFA
jgi:hypothetical protein